MNHWGAEFSDPPPPKSPFSRPILLLQKRTGKSHRFFQAPPPNHLPPSPKPSPPPLPCCYLSSKDDGWGWRCPFRKNASSGREWLNGEQVSLPRWQHLLRCLGGKLWVWQPVSGLMTWVWGPNQTWVGLVSDFSWSEDFTSYAHSLAFPTPNLFDCCWEAVGSFDRRMHVVFWYVCYMLCFCSLCCVEIILWNCIVFHMFFFKSKLVCGYIVFCIIGKCFFLHWFPHFFPIFLCCPVQDCK